MAAMVRGGASNTARPRSKDQASQGQASNAKSAARPARGKSPKSRKGPSDPYAQTKLGSAGVLEPRAAAIGAGVILGVALLVTAATGDRPHKIALALRGGLAQNMALFGFKLNKVHIQGVDDIAQHDILAATGLYKGAPIFGEDLDELRERVQMVGWVKEAKVVRLLPDTLVLAITPRPTMAVWQHNGVAQVIDDEGKLIREADPGRFPGLPLVVGAGANEEAGTILPLVKTRPRLMERLEALVRVDGRRWDLRLKDGSLIQLPAVGADSALIQLEQLDQRTRVLDLGFARIDLRDPETIAVRPRAEAAIAPPAATPND